MLSKEDNFATALGASEIATKLFFQKYALTSLVEMFKLSWDVVSVGAFAWWQADGRQGAEPLWGKEVTPLLKKTTNKQDTWKIPRADNMAQLRAEVSHS